MNVARLPIDLHAHVLPGLDDGPQTIDEAVAICAALAASGVHTVVASSHVKPGNGVTVATREAALASLRLQLEQRGINLGVRGGGELDLATIQQALPEELHQWSPAAGLLLVETPFGDWNPDLGLACVDLVAAGWKPLVAHPERNRGVQNDPCVLDALLSGGVSFHVTTGGVVGSFGEHVTSCAIELVRSKRAVAIVTDSHDVDRRPPLIEEAWQVLLQAGIPANELTQLFVGAPAELLGGSTG